MGLVLPAAPAPVAAYIPWRRAGNLLFVSGQIPMRDGARLQTAIFRPTDRTGPLPILVTRTPYGVPARAPMQVPPPWKEFSADGYVFVIQNLRGRFKSEGTFTIFPAIDHTLGTRWTGW